MYYTMYYTSIIMYFVDYILFNNTCMSKAIFFLDNLYIVVFPLVGSMS